MAMKLNGKSIVSSGYDEKVMFFKDVTLGHHEAQLRFRLIHLWEAWNPVKKVLIGLEMLLIDEQQGSVYKLNNFYGSRNKSVFWVADHTTTVSFSWDSKLSVLQDCRTPFDEDSFIRMKSFTLTLISKEISTILYGHEIVNCLFGVILPTLLMINGIDVVGHMKLVDGQSINKSPVLDEVEIAKARRLLVYIQSHDGPLMKLYLWDQAAREFCKKFNSYENTPTVLLVMTVNTKTLGGTLALTSMFSSRVFMNYDVQPTIDYVGWLGSNPAIVEQVNAEVVTKRESMTIGELFSYIKQESAKEAFFECTTTIDDIVHGSAWYYIGCSGCHTKVTKGPTSLICTNNKCEKVNVDGVAHEQAFFVLLGDAGRELTGKPASELVRSYFEGNGNQDDNHEASVPEALISTIGQRHKFCVKVTEHNSSGKTQSLTVTKILLLDTQPVTVSSEGNNTTATSEETFKSRVDSAEGSKRTCDSDEIEEAKHHKRGN
ncbi:hypothetical protein DY000_02005270 [Brassica cretica]|uniref:Replication factor A C-terminal domain-containing protein n=1 Tax=Brassica cretica TaxID=69181 RepID=A0ABQ7C131_BRACR|nr:hypothetical protein DY000_02005270 [Brassica cretica]